jgi:hypothetical protein
MKRIFIIQKHKILFCLLMFFVLTSSASFADESAMFSTVAPDALVVLDLSGSMSWTPAGGTATTSGLPCTANTCSRLDIAKTALFKMFDSDSNNLIDSNDESNLNIRIGYMRFYGCQTDESSVNYTSGCNTLKYDINTQYSKIYCNKSAPNTCVITDGSAPCIKTESASGGTPLGASYQKQKLILMFINLQIMPKHADPNLLFLLLMEKILFHVAAVVLQAV